MTNDKRDGETSEYFSFSVNQYGLRLVTRDLRPIRTTLGYFK